VYVHVISYILRNFLGKRRSVSRPVCPALAYLKTPICTVYTCILKRHTLVFEDSNGMKTGDVCLTIIGSARRRPSNLSQSDADMLVRDWRAGSSGQVYC
jgi:hypothetical protein